MIVITILTCYNCIMKRIFTEEHRKKLSESHKGQKPTNLEQLRLYRLGRPLSEEHKQKISNAQIGKYVSKETRIKIGLSGKGRIPYNKGINTSSINKNCKVCDIEFISNKSADRKYCGIKCYRKDNIKKNHYKWIDDRDKIIGRHNRDIHDPDIKQWRKAVFIRDNYKCKLQDSNCSGKIEAHHIFRWKDYKDLRYEISNGITLCHQHHSKIKNKEDENIDLFKSLIN